LRRRAGITIQLTEAPTRAMAAQISNAAAKPPCVTSCPLISEPSAIPRNSALLFIREMAAFIRAI
jgi:hypothetical protein